MQKFIQINEFYEAIDLIITPVIVTDNSTVCLYVNKAFSDQIGYKPEEIPDQKSWFEMVYKDGGYRNAVKESWFQRKETAKANGAPYVHMVTKVYCADGSSKWFDIHESIYGEIKVVTFLDVNELQESNEELTNVLKQKDILLSIIAHDVRSPLSNIRQIIDNYKTMDLSQQEVGEIFSSMGGQIDYIFNIINSLLIRTSGERGDFVEKREMVYLRPFFSKYVEYYRERMDKQNTNFVFELPDKAAINYDPFILDVICRNLIDNAIKYSPKNGDIYVSFEKKADGAEIIIKDNGPGMSAEQSERILHNKGSRRLKNQITDSFGLGLVMAKEILERSGGKLSILSELGKGASFIIYLLNT